MVPTNSQYGIMFSENAINRFTISTNGPAFQTAIQIGNAVYRGTEAQTIRMTNDQPYSTIAFTMPTEDTPYLSVAGFVKIPTLLIAPATYDLVVIGTVQTNLPYLAEDWVLQVSCGPTNILGMEDASSVTGTKKMSWSSFPANQWLYFTLAINTTNGTETALVRNASDWTLIMAATNTMSVADSFVSYWLFGNNQTGDEPGVNFCFCGLNWTNTPPPPPPAAPAPYTSPTNQLIAQFKFNGDFSDASDNHFDGGAWGTINWVAGQDGQTNHAANMALATMSSLATNPVSAMTISYWVKTTASGGMPVAHTEFVSWNTAIDGGGHVQWSLHTTDGNIGIQTTGKLADDTWHLVVCTWDGLNRDQRARIYLDGVLDSTGPALTGTIIPATSQLTVGSGIAGYYFAGALDDVRVYGRALSASEISAIYAAGADGDINL
jgi:hypothetical protein